MAVQTRSAVGRAALRLALALLLAGVALACSTPPLVLAPTVRPVDVVPDERLGQLHITSFVDVSGEDDRSFNRKVYAHPPVNALNDALLISLRESEAFQNVDRDQSLASSGFALEGELLDLDHEESWLKFAPSSSSLAIEARCRARYRLRDLATGDVLLEREVEGTGRGAASVSGGGETEERFINLSTGDIEVRTTRESPTYDSTQGIERSLSAAIGEAVGSIVGDVIREVMRRSGPASSSAEAPAVSSEEP